MAKIERKYLAHFINAAPLGEEAASYEQLGNDLEEYPAGLSAQVETRRNILGQSSVVISGYEKVDCIHGISTRIEKVNRLLERLNHAQVSPCHFRDVVLMQEGVDHPLGVVLIYLKVRIIYGRVSIITAFIRIDELICTKSTDDDQYQTNG